MSRQLRLPGRVARNKVNATRYGVQLRRVATQSYTTGVLANFTWDTEDSDPYGFIAVPSSTITIPTNGDGIYAAQMFFACSVASQLDIIEVVAGGKTVDLFGSGSGNQGTSWGPFPLAAGNTFVVALRQSSGGSFNVTGQLNLYRLAR